MGNECNANESDCLNCRAIRVPKQDRQHSARDRNCPIIMIRRENAARRNIQYYSDTQERIITQSGRADRLTVLTEQ